MDDEGRLVIFLLLLAFPNVATYACLGNVYYLHPQLFLTYFFFLCYFFYARSAAHSRKSDELGDTRKKVSTIIVRSSVVFIFVVATAFLFYADHSEAHEGDEDTQMAAIRSALSPGPCSADGSAMRRGDDWFFCMKETDDPTNVHWVPVVHEPSIQGREKFALVSAHGNTRGAASYEEMATVSELNKQLYADLHGYACYFDDDLLTEEMSWNRKSAIRTESLRRHLMNHEYVYWTDVDLVLVNAAHRLEDIVAMAPHADVILTKDWGGQQVNPGSIIMRRSQWSMDFLIMWEEAIEKQSWHDDLMALQDLMAAKPDVAARLVFLPQYTMNSYPHLSFANGGYTPKKLGQTHDFYVDNDFAVHVVNCLRDAHNNKDPLSCVGLCAYYMHMFRMKLIAAWQRRANAFAAGDTLEDVLNEERARFQHPPPGLQPQFQLREVNTENPCPTDEGIKPFWNVLFGGRFQRFVDNRDGREYCMWHELDIDGSKKYEFNEYEITPDGQEVVIFDPTRGMFVKLTRRMHFFSQDKKSWNQNGAGQWDDKPNANIYKQAVPPPLGGQGEQGEQEQPE